MYFHLLVTCVVCLSLARWQCFHSFVQIAFIGLATAINHYLSSKESFLALNVLNTHIKISC